MKLLRYFLFVSLLAPIGANAATVDVWFGSPSSNSIAVGDVFSVDVLVGNYAGTGTMAINGAVNVAFDTNILNVASVAPNVGPGNVGQSVGITSEAAGTIDTIGLSDFIGFNTDPFVFATVSFEAMQVGIASLALSNPQDMVFNWVDNAAIDVTPNFINGSVTVVPLPAAAWLMLSGLAACGFLGRRKTTAPTGAVA